MRCYEVGICARRNHADRNHARHNWHADAPGLRKRCPEPRAAQQAFMRRSIHPYGAIQRSCDGAPANKVQERDGVTSVTRPTVCVTRWWVGQANVTLTEPTPSHAKCLKTRRLPSVGCTLCWAALCIADSSANHTDFTYAPLARLRIMTLSNPSKNSRTMRGGGVPDSPCAKPWIRFAYSNVASAPAVLARV